MTDTVPSLTSLAHGAGCGCKLPAAAVHRIASRMGLSDDPNVIVGPGTSDDAGVYRVAEDLALVQTVDFFTPIVDDPYDFGRIAATNALSELYAMGGKPVTAMNLVAFPLDVLGEEVLAEVLRGGEDVARRAGVAIVGGHSIDDPEPKYGLAVTGTIDPGKVVRNSTAREGDALFLSKPVGGGVISTGAKRGIAPPEALAAMVETMTTLNRDASRLGLIAGASAMTDVTGYGLLGHLAEMCSASGLTAEIEAGAVPAIEGALDLLSGEMPPVSGGTRRNREHAEPGVGWDAAVGEERRWLLCDAMTSGGLLIAAPEGSGAPGVRIGRLVARTTPQLDIRVTA